MAKTTVVPDLLHTLPFHDALTWENFQSFCTDVLYKKFQSIDTREYLSKGSSQHGIDIYSILKNEEKISVAQCKLEDYMGPQQVLDIIELFVGDTEGFAGVTKQFILCTSADLGRQRDEEKTISESRAKLAPYGIELIVWDQRGLSKELRTNASPEIINIVYRYFNEDIALAFYGDIWKDYLAKLRVVRKQRYPVPKDYIPRNIVSYNDQLNKEKKSWSYWYDEESNTLLNLLEDNTENTPNQVILLSTAGFGKTLELNHAAGYFSSDSKLIYPVKFSLVDYEGQSVETILTSYDVDWRNIGTQNMLLLFDALDEVSEIFSQDFIKHLNAFIEQNPDCKTVVSSRYNFYDVRHPSLRGFEIYLLHPLNARDVESYIDKKIGLNKDDFIQVLHEHAFFEYIQNPYYLTRLVRFYNDRSIVFPKNKTELFDRILFEQLEKDEGTYNIRELKEQLLPPARQIAFCMTVAGKSALSDEEIKIVIQDPEIRKLLNHFSIFNRNATIQGSWSFEHKNLQEYLSASVFSNVDFNKIHGIVSFKYDNNKLLPRFLNTISFLFEVIDKNSQLFIDLFAWINANEPELLVRFEKEQLSRETRHDIFFRIFRYYKEKDITIRVSSQFSYQELADFIEIDPEIIDFFRNELEAGLSLELAYDTVGIIAHCKRPYVHRSKIESLLFWIIDNPKYHHHIHAEAIRTFASLQFNESSIFAKIIASKIDLGLLEVRNACIFFLNTVDYYEDYSHFIIQSINVIESGQKASGMSGSFYYLKKLILAFKVPGKIKEIFQFAIEDRNCFERHSHAREFHFDYQEVTDLLLKAATAYKSDKTILPVTYRLFCQQKHITIDWEWFKLYKQFFEKTCGTDTVFFKFYRYAKKQRDIMAFADEACCSFLIKEYQAGKFDDKQMFVYRNTMSYLNRDLFIKFYDELKDLDNGKFIIEDILVDYNDVRLKQLEKNQLMLLDRDLFLEEAVTIFGIISKENISTSDFWYSENIQLRKFQLSLVLETIRDMCIHDEEKSITKEEFLEKYSDIEVWNGFVVESTVELLKKKDVEVNSTLIELIKKWCSKKINELDFENSIVDNGMSFRYTPLIEFVKDVYLLVQPELEDELLLKMLPSDYEGYYGWSDTNSKSVSAVITEKVNDKELLQNVVLNNIKSNKLATLVLCTHFTICDKLNYRQCLPFLYSTIVSNTLLTDHNRVHLTEYYINLSGQVADFVGCLKVPEIATEEARYASWHWFLIEKLQFIVPDRITEISLQILADPDQAVNKLHAAESLIQLSRIEGLEYVDTYVRETGIIPYDHKWSNFQQYIPDLPIEKAITIFCSLLEFSYENNLQKKLNGSHSIEVAFFGSLNTICSLDYSYFSLVKNHLAEMILKFSASPIISSLKHQSERFIQRYFESQKQEIDINTAILIYDSISG